MRNWFWKFEVSSWILNGFFKAFHQAAVIKWTQQQVDLQRIEVFGMSWDLKRTETGWNGLRNRPKRCFVVFDRSDFLSANLWEAIVGGTKLSDRFNEINVQSANFSGKLSFGFLTNFTKQFDAAIIPVIETLRFQTILIELWYGITRSPDCQLDRLRR